MKQVKTGYVEPEGYIPEEIRKKLKIGEYAEKKPEPERKSTRTREEENAELRRIIRGNKG